eukprot:SAG31_NODE_3860_length_3814_cov_2.455720_3_plen_109_part_00
MRFLKWLSPRGESGPWRGRGARARAVVAWRCDPAEVPIMRSDEPPRAAGGRRTYSCRAGAHRAGPGHQSRGRRGYVTALIPDDRRGGERWVVSAAGLRLRRAFLLAPT